MTYEYDELFGWIVYDEDGCPISRHFETEDEVKNFIGRYES